MYTQTKQSGFTLIEIMIAVGILAIVASIALPTYNGYMQTSRTSECQNEISMIKLAEEEFFLENNTYFPGANIGAIQVASTGFYTPSYPTPAALAAANCSYVVIAGSTGAIATSYGITAAGQNDLNAATVLVDGN